MAVIFTIFLTNFSTLSSASHSLEPRNWKIMCWPGIRDLRSHSEMKIVNCASVEPRAYSSRKAANSSGVNFRGISELLFVSAFI